MAMQAFPNPEFRGVHIQSKVSLQFEEIYLRVLRKENRIYSDAEVKELPNTFFYNLHRQEWKQREKSMERLLRYLKRIQASSRIMDLGCGNGWLAGQIAKSPQFELWGVDVNLFELQQAARVFSAPNLHFAYGDIFEDIFPAGSFDCIILCKTIEFFPNLQQLINRCRYFLKSEGEIHIIDSPLYQEKEIEAAREASLRHFEGLGCPEMSAIYFHHLKQDLAPFDYHYIYKPNWMGRKESPYPWVKIVN